MVLVFAAACDLGGESPVEWTIDPVSMGASRVDGAPFDPLDGSRLGAAFPQLMPGWDEGSFPAWDVPTAIWEVALHELVADAGVCPFATLDGSATVYQMECRSKHGYEWAGEVRADAWEDEGLEFSRYDFDVSVVADVESPRFDELRLEGSILRGISGEVTHVDVNLQAELLGYFEARQLPDDPRVVAWADWAASGSLEQEGGALRVDTHADIGGSGAFPLLSADLGWSSACPLEPQGEAQMGDSARARFDGAEACDACAAIVREDGETAACAP